MASGLSEIWTRASGKPSRAAAEIWSSMYSISSSSVSSRSRRMPDVGVDRARREHQTGVGDDPLEPVDERVVEVGETAEAREPDDLQARAHPVRGDLADQALEVDLAGMERAGEAVEGDALDRAAGLGHRASAVICVSSDSSIISTPWAVTM